MNKKAMLVIIIMIAALGLNAQYQLINDSIRLKQRKTVRQSIYLLRNANNLVPVKNLTKKIACVSVGSDSINVFRQTILKYADVDSFNIKKNVSDSILRHIKNTIRKYDLVIVSFHHPENNEGNVNSLMNEFFTFTADSLPSIITVFGNDSFLNSFNKAGEVKTLLFSDVDVVDNQYFAAQIIFGGLTATAKLKTTISEHFKAGDGLQTQEQIRLGFELPEELGLNSRYLNEKIDSIAENGIKERAFPGCQILAAKDGIVFFHKTYGFHTYDSIVPVRKSDIYDFASITKITGPLPALMKLYDEGKFKLDTPLAVYWPPFKHSDKKSLSVREVLAHQAQLKPGIAYWKDTYKKNGKFKWHTFKSDSSKKFSIKVVDHLFLYKNYQKKIYKGIKKSELTGKSEYLYSGLSFFLYPQIIKNLTGMDYEQYLQKNFYKPLGASTLGYNPLRRFSIERIIPTENDTFFRMQQIHGTVHDEGAAMMGGVSGNAGLFGTTLDLAKLMQMYLNMGHYGDVQYISDTTMKEFTRCQFPENGNRRGLGFDKPLLKNKENGSTAVDVSDKSFGHSGYTGTLVWVDPENGILFVFMSNRVYPTRNNSMIYQLNIRPSIQQVIYDAIRNQQSGIEN